MDVTTIAGASLLMKTAQTQQAMSLSMVKQAAQGQQQMANMLAQNVQNGQQLAQQSSDGNSYLLSIYA